ncbi:conjugal transfer protein [Bacillus changyiensis]|uniref:conjugal transfer protein n=1 Tax=Bacillus changyiensis TaxID=3004103 RepID=UPI0022E21010|nr:conjugal transfer protein [Bacillus changyiensis]MDA1478036.1 conjugal transfer protein [Bacillus changyiensis]
MLKKKKDDEKKEESSFFRKLIQKIKQVQRPEKINKKVPRDRSKVIAITLWCSLSGLLLLALVSVLLSVNTRSVVNDIKNNSNKPADNEQQKISVTAANHFIDGFIKEYMNIKNDQDYIAERKKNLESYMAKQSESNFDEEERFQIDGFKGDRELKDFSLYNMKEGDNYNLLQYKVTYINTFPVEKEVEKTVKKGKKKKKVKEKVTENEKVEKQMLLNIPIISKGDSFAVSSVPYFTQIYDLKGDITLKNTSETKDEYTGEKKESIEKFLTTFFEKYASEKKEEMVYMMKEPEALEGSLIFSEINNVKIFGAENSFEVLCAVQFKEKENDIPIIEHFTLEITEKSGQYYVNKLKHQ